MTNNGKAMLMEQYSLPEFEYLANNQWVFTEKVDGTNIRVKIHDDGGVSFGGRTDNANIPATLIDRLLEIFGPQREKMAEMFPSGACLYGEGFGPKIQKVGSLYGERQDFVLFDIKVGPWWLRRPDIEDVAAKLGIQVVPIIGEGTIDDMVDITKHGFCSIWGHFDAEGIVARPKVELRTRSNERIITKLKTRDFQ